MTPYEHTRAARTKEGCNVDQTHDVLSKGMILSLLEALARTDENSGTVYENSLHVFREIDSTNAYARSAAVSAGILRDSTGTLTEAGKRLHRSAYLADGQTAGRGRTGRGFFSPARCGLYLSVLFCPENRVCAPARFTAAAAVAVSLAVERLTGTECHIKWVNDVFCGGKKVCGILSEGISSFETGRVESLVTGIGINVRRPPDDFPAEIRGIAGALFGGASNQPVPPANFRNNMAAQVLHYLFGFFEGLSSDETWGGVMSEYRRRSLVLGQEITVYPVAGDSSSAFRARAVDIDADAALVVETGTGEWRTLHSGEVRLGSANFA